MRCFDLCWEGDWINSDYCKHLWSRRRAAAPCFLAPCWHSICCFHSKWVACRNLWCLAAGNYSCDSAVCLWAPSSQFLFLFFENLHFHFHFHSHNFQSYVTFSVLLDISENAAASFACPVGKPEEPLLRIFQNLSGLHFDGDPAYTEDSDWPRGCLQHAQGLSH